MISKSRKSLSTMMCLLLFSAVACAQQPVPQQAPTGVVSLYFANGTLQCTFPAVSGTLRFTEESQSGGSHCKPLADGGYIQLRNFPSATKIWMVNGRPEIGQSPVSPKKCGFDDWSAFRWWGLKTIKEPTTTPEKIRIEDLSTLPIGSVVKPGVVFVDYKNFQNAANPNEVNCLVIEVSP